MNIELFLVPHCPGLKAHVKFCEKFWLTEWEKIDLIKALILIWQCLMMGKFYVPTKQVKSIPTNGSN